MYTCGYDDYVCNSFVGTVPRPFVLLFFDCLQGTLGHGKGTNRVQIPKKIEALQGVKIVAAANAYTHMLLLDDRGNVYRLTNTSIISLCLVFNSQADQKVVCSVAVRTVMGSLDWDIEKTERYIMDIVACFVDSDSCHMLSQWLCIDRKGTTHKNRLFLGEWQKSQENICGILPFRFVVPSEWTPSISGGTVSCI